MGRSGGGGVGEGEGPGEWGREWKWVSGGGRGGRVSEGGSGSR